MFEVRLLDAAEKELADLDNKVGKRIVSRLHWLAENFEEIKPEALSGDLAGFCKLRVGDYRVIYQILAAEQVLQVHSIGHRRDVYRKK